MRPAGHFRAHSSEIGDGTSLSSGLEVVSAPGIIHHAPAADRAAADVQARTDEDRAVLAARGLHVACACGQQGTSGSMLNTPGLRHS